jgi:hypothetical protein
MVPRALFPTTVDRDRQRQIITIAAGKKANKRKAGSGSAQKLTCSGGRSRLDERAAAVVVKDLRRAKRARAAEPRVRIRCAIAFLTMRP